MKDKLNKFLGLEDSLEQMPVRNAHKLKYLQLDQSIPPEKDREIWQNILRETSSAESKPVFSGFGYIRELFRRRKMVFAGVSLLVFLCAGLFLFLRAPGITDVTVAAVNGNVLINGNPLAEEAHLRDRDTVEAPEGVSAKVLLGKGNVVFLDSGTRISLEMSGKCFRMNRKSFRMNLIRGRIGAVLNNKNAFSEYRITTPLAVVVVKGTSFFMDASIENKTYLCICNGSLEYYTRTDAQPKSLASSHHKALEFTLEGNTVKVSDGTMKYHDDQYMDFIADLINEKIPWGK